MLWVVRAARTMDDVKECHFTDKNKVLEYVEALKKVKRGNRRHYLDGGN
jgi:hypothetical protein